MRWILTGGMIIPGSAFYGLASFTGCQDAVTYKDILKAVSVITLEKYPIRRKKMPFFLCSANPINSTEGIFSCPLNDEIQEALFQYDDGSAEDEKRYVTLFHREQARYLEDDLIASI